jgi:hypothetical protein
MKYFAGLDVSLDETAICIVDEDGVVIREGKAASEPDCIHTHPSLFGNYALTLGYRLEADGVSVAYCCDHAH